VELADTSAWTWRNRDPVVAADFAARVPTSIATCGPVMLELLWTARGSADFRALRLELEVLPRIAVSAEVWDRAMDVWQQLVDQGRHRQIGQADLVIAAAAELAGVGLCHYDRDFDVIAGVTGQPVRAIAPLGSL
jgi:predicted nucleic acid-binding protein